MAHRGPSAVAIRLGDDEREELARWSGGSSRLAVRARIVLACAEPGSVNEQVAVELGVSALTVGRWRPQFAAAGLAGLTDAARPGRPKAGLELTDAERGR